MTDDLIDRARFGDQDAWRALYSAHAGRLLVWLRSLAPAEAHLSAEDLASDTWLTAATRIADFNGDEDAFAAWLFVIARNTHANAARRSWRRGTRPSADPVVDVAPGPLLEGVVAGTDWVRRALGDLPVREREVIACVDVVGLDTATTAEILGISQGSVRIARHRGLGRLRAAAAQVPRSPVSG